MKESEIIKLVTDRSKLIEKISKLEKKLNDISLIIERNCTHKKTHIEQKYYQGGYLNKEEYHTKKVCNYCYKIISDEIKYGSYC